MIRVDRKFLFGDFEKFVLVRTEKDTVITSILKFAFQNGTIDSAIGTTTDSSGNVHPAIATNENELENFSEIFFMQSGQNILIKKSIQKYRFEKIAIVGPACIMDGINKLQYYGIGCNWAKSRIALKLGILCVGAVSKEGLKCELLESEGNQIFAIRNYLTDKEIIFESKERKVAVNLETHYNYVNIGCKYCLNLSSRGVDITFVPLKINEQEFPVIVRSKRGEEILKSMENAGTVTLRKAEDEHVKTIENILSKIMKYNIEHILERAELKLPSNKWNEERFKKFYKLWNSVGIEILDERIL